jgi:hypothetical protein
VHPKDSSPANRARVRTPGIATLLAALSLLAALPGGACSPSDERPPPEFGQVRRLTMEPAERDLDDRPRLAIVAIFDPLEERDRWTLTYDKARVKSKRTAMQSAPILWIEGTTPQLARKLEGVGEFNQIALSVVGTSVNKDVALRFRKDGETLLSTGRKRFGTQDAQTVLFDLPFHGEVPDEIELVFTSAWRSTMHIIVGIASVALLKKPLIDWMPDAGEGAALVRVGREGRRAVGLSSAAPLRARFTPRAGEQLRFSFGVPEIFQRPGAAASFRVHLSAEDHSIERSFEVADQVTPIWHAASIDLKAFAERATELRITLDPGPENEERAIAFGEPSLSVPMDNPPSVLLLTSDTHRADHIGAAPTVSASRHPSWTSSRPVECTSSIAGPPRTSPCPPTCLSSPACRRGTPVS